MQNGFGRTIFGQCFLWAENDRGQSGITDVKSKTNSVPLSRELGDLRWCRMTFSSGSLSCPAITYGWFESALRHIPELLGRMPSNEQMQSMEIDYSLSSVLQGPCILCGHWGKCGCQWKGSSSPLSDAWISWQASYCLLPPGTIGAFSYMLKEGPKAWANPIHGSSLS